MWPHSAYIAFFLLLSPSSDAKEENAGDFTLAGNSQESLKQNEHCSTISHSPRGNAENKHATKRSENSTLADGKYTYIMCGSQAECSEQFGS